nr:YlaH-like family protein [Bacillus subtilis]
MNDVSERLSFFAALYQVDRRPAAGMWSLYGTIFVLAVIVFKLGFAKRLPVLKSAVVYVFLALGRTVLTFLGVFLPVAEGLVVAALILIIYKIRLYQSKKGQSAKS